MSNDTNRRDFLKSLGTVGATGVVAAVGVDAPASAEPQAAAAAGASAASAPVSHAYTFFTPPEAAFIEAAVDRLIPADDLTPGGTDCGVAIFIDRQLAGAWGTGDKTYMQGPWEKGVATQGYQSPLTPGEFFRAGIAATNAYSRKTLQKDLDRLTADQQVKLLQDLEAGKPLEYACMTGAVIEIANAVGVEVPRIEALGACVALLDARVRRATAASAPAPAPRS